MKKLLALLLCLVMVASVIAGCGPTANQPDNTGDQGGATGDDTNPAVRDTLPDPSEITINIGIPDQGSVEDYDTNALTLWLEEQTGYDIEFTKYMPSENDYKTKLSTQMVDGKPLPDMLLGFNLGRSYYQDLGEDDYLVDLKQFFEDEELSGAWWDRLEELPEETQNFIKSKLYSDDGEHIWALPSTDYSEYDSLENTMFINKTWLDELQLEVPTDRDSLYKVLKAFKTQDPNGNGKPDEYPILSGIGNMFGGDPVDWIINTYMFHNDSLWRVGEDGQVYLPYFSDEYREALIYINKLVDEGLLDESCWTFSTDNLKGMLAADLQTVGAFCGHPTLVFAAENEGIYNWIPLNNFGYTPIRTGSYEFTSFITTDCEYPEAAWNVYMLLCSEEGSFRVRYGQKDVDWVDADAGSKSFLGYDAKIKVLNESLWMANANTQCWNKVTGVTMGIGTENEYCQLSDDSTEWTKYKMDLMKQTYDAHMKGNEKRPDNVISYQIVYTAEEEEIIDVWRANIQSLITQARTSFCRGTSTNGKYTNPADDAQWAAYKQQAIDDGYEEWRSMAQAVYDDVRN